MRQTIKAGLLAFVLILGLVTLLAGYAGMQGGQDIGGTTQSQPAESQTQQTEQQTQMPTQQTAPTEGPQRPTLPAPSFSISSPYVFVYDMADNRILFSKGDMDKHIPPASLTKLFTAYVALQYLDPAAIITVGEEVTWIDPDSSVAHISKGQRLSVEMCVEGMMLQSGNDAAYALAVAAGRTIQGNPNLAARVALSVFVGKMNDEAMALGLEDTHFANPDGIDAPGHYSSMNDLIAISALALDIPMVRKYCAMAQDRVTYASGQTVTWKNTNELLHPKSPFYCEDACGLKTGSTSGAGKCLISAFNQTKDYLLIGVLGGKGENDRYRDTLKLYNYYTDLPAKIKNAA